MMRTTNAQTRRRVGFTLLALLLLGTAGYGWLGGFKNVLIDQVAVPGYWLVGVEYKGSANDAKLGELFTRFKTYHTEGKLRGTLAAVYYDTKEEEKGNVHTFLGVIVSDSSAAVPANCTRKYFAGQQAVQAQITAHYTIAPAPNRVKERMKDFASSKGLLLQKMTIERYINERNIILQIPVEKIARK